MPNAGKISGAAMESDDAWRRLRGAMKDVFTEYGGGAAYLRAERGNFGSIEVEQNAALPYCKP
jgi:hypothetical protein